jgi:MraZ protein
VAISELFRGKALNAIDAKGRVSLPADFRAKVQSRYRRSVHETGYDPALSDPDDRRAGKSASLVKDPERPCLVGYDDVYANAYLAQITERHADKTGIERERAIRHDQGYFGASEEVAWDVNGRIVLTPRMRARAGIDGHVWFFARGEVFELWNPIAFYNAHKESEPDWAEDCRLDCEERGIAL